MNDFSLFYFDHFFANAAMPRSRSRSVWTDYANEFAVPISTS